MPGDDTTTPADSGMANAVSSTRAEIRYNPIQLPKFSGTIPTPRNEASFRVWKYTLESVRDEENLRDVQVKGIIRRSLIGEAAEVLISLPITASCEEIVSELADTYGCTTPKIDGWAAFHGASQTSTESITDWKMRLLRLYKDADPEDQFSHHKDAMLGTALWTRLYNKDLRVATAGERKSSFAVLFRSLKENEPLYTSSKLSTKPAKSAKVIDSEIEQLRNEVKELKIQNSQLKEEVRRSKDDRPKGKRMVTCYHCAKPGHIIANCPDRLNAQRQGVQGNPLLKKQ